MEALHSDPMRPRPAKPVAPPESREARLDVRVSIRAVLRPTARAQEIYGWVHNLSGGGMFVRSAEGLSPDTECHVRLVWKDGPVFRAAFLKGWVVYGTPTGMGVQFDLPTAEVQEVLHRLDHRHVTHAA